MSWLLGMLIVMITNLYHISQHWPRDFDGDSIEMN